MSKGTEQGDERRHWTEIPNDGLDRLLRSDLTLSQQKIAFLVSRFTHGFGRAEAELRQGFIAQRTGLSKRTVQNEFAASGRLFGEGWLVKRKIKGKASALAWGPRLTEADQSLRQGTAVRADHYPGEGSGSSPLPLRRGEGTTTLAGAPYKRKHETKVPNGALELLSRFPRYKPKPSDAERLERLAADFSDVDLTEEVALAADWCAANPSRAWRDPLLGLRRSWLPRAREKHKAESQAGKPAIDRAEVARQDRELAERRRRTKL